jgi:hypothetical protein
MRSAGHKSPAIGALIGGLPPQPASLSRSGRPSLCRVCHGLTSIAPAAGRAVRSISKPSDRLPLASVVGAHAVAPHLYPFALRIIPASTRHPGDPGGGPNLVTSQSTLPAPVAGDELVHVKRRISIRERTLAAHQGPQRHRNPSALR